MTKKLFELLKKLDLIDILNIEDSYFKTLISKKSKKLSKDVLLFNYSEYSPYAKFDIYSNFDKGNINLWFTDKKQDTTVVLPESYILLNYLKKNDINGLVLFDTSPKKLLVIKDGTLKRQISKSSITPYEIELIKKEFAINDTYKYDKKEYENHLENAINNISFKDVIEFFSIEINFKNIFNLLIKKVSIPLSIFVTILLSIEVLNYAYVQEKLSSTKEQYKLLKLKTTELRDSIYEIEDVSNKYVSLGKELENNSRLIEIVESISEVLKEVNASFLFLKISDADFNLKVDTNQTSVVFGKIVNLGYFDNLKIHSTIKMRYSNNEQVLIKGKIK